MKRLRRKQAEAELDITAFMNLMIILVPVLLMSMAFAHITVLDLRLPDAAPSDLKDKRKQLEVVIREDHIDVNYPIGNRLKRIGKVTESEASGTSEGAEASSESKESEANEAQYDFELLRNTLKELKRRLREQGADRRDILVLAEASTDYQAIVNVMDTVRSYPDVVVTDVVQAELFPDIALGDAPPAAN